MARNYLIAAAGVLAAMVMPAAAQAHGYDGRGYYASGHHRYHDGGRRDWRGHDRWERRRHAEARRHWQRERWERSHRRHGY